MRVRGLKHFKKFNNSEKIEVAPHAGAWIETDLSEQILNACPRRTPCGCVD